MVVGLGECSVVKEEGNVGRGIADMSTDRDREKRLADGGLDQDGGWKVAKLG